MSTAGSALPRPSLYLASLLVGLTACADAATSPADTADADAVDGRDAADAADGTDASESPDAADVSDTTPGLADNFGVVEDEGDPVCDQLDLGHCLFPFPSDHFRVVDGERPHLALAGAMPVLDDGSAIAADAFATRDGWSPLTPVVFTLAGLAVPPPTYVDHQPFDVARSLTDQSPTLIIDTVTGERVAHWLERDHFAHDAGQTIVFLRLAAPLAWGRRYVVAVRGLADASGATLPATPAFAALRDATASHHAGVHARRARFERDVFAVLTTAGVARADLQLAWDFTTASEADTTGLVRAMRDHLYDTLGEAGPSYVIDDVEVPADDPHIARRVLMTVEVPSFLLPADARGVRRVRLDADGRPLAQGVERVPVEVQIPASVLSAPGTAPAIVYGHGLFYSRAEGRQGWLRELAARQGLVVVALDMEGMNEPAIPAWTQVIANDLGRFPELVEWPMQGVMNHLAVERLLVGGLASSGDAALAGDGGALVYDPTQVRYYGNSQGGTLGAVVSALSLDVERAVLGVPGCSWSYLIHKSVGFAGFAQLLHLLMSDPHEFAAFMGLVQTGFDRVEPLGLAALLGPGATPAKTVLLQVAKEDATVDNQVSFLCGRTYGAALLEPAVRPVWGLPTAASPHVGNTLVEYDFGHPDNPDPFAPAPVATDTHEALRRLAVAQDQLVRFLASGEVTHLCSGVCDPD